MSVRYEQAETLLNAIGIYSVLSQYDPLFVGTLPIDVDIPGSDVDVICDVSDHAAFARLLTENYGDQPGFEVISPATENSYTVCRFSCVTFDIEIYGEDRPVREQNAWRHMEAERKLLLVGGEDARLAIRSLKRSGLKTEPAFAEHFGIGGNPYDALLEVADLNVSEILSRFG